MSAGEFRWNEWNLDHAAKHGCTVSEIERVVLRGAPGMRIDDGKWMIEGRGTGDRLVRVIFLLDPDRTFYVVHAMPLTTRRRRR